MGWSHPDVSLEDLVALVKGFVDILVLASGYQSSGRPALWDVDNIKKAIKWGLFFEDVLKQLQDCDGYKDSVKELDEALHGLTSNPSFPQGLVHLSSATLSKAGELVLQHLVQTNPLQVSHLTAVLTAIIEIDVLHAGASDFTSTAYIGRLMSHMASLNLAQTGKESFNRPMASSLAHDSNIIGSDVNKNFLPAKSNVDLTDYSVHYSCFLIQELLKRQALVSCVSSIETGVGILLKILTKKNIAVRDDRPLLNELSDLQEELLLEHFAWSQWKSKCLSYLLNKRTIKKLSGAKLIFSAPKTQFSRIFDSLKASGGLYNDVLLEIMEISLLGFISRRWDILIEHFMSHTCDNSQISKQYSGIQHLLQENPQHLDSRIDELNVMERDILEYVTTLLVSQPHKLWLLPPVLVAAAIPSWSVLLRIYLREIEKQFVGDSGITSPFGLAINEHSGNGITGKQSSHRPVNMMSHRLGSIRKICAMSWAKGSGGGETEVSLVKVQATVEPSCWRQSKYMFRQVLSKMKLEWRGIIKPARSNSARFSYDPHSYSQNFDDGLLQDHLTPCKSLKTMAYAS